MTATDTTMAAPVAAVALFREPARHVLSVIRNSRTFATGGTMSENEATPARPCSAPEAQQFDFWIGEWDAAWGENGRGSNRIQKIMDGCVILENFDGGSSMPLKGMSVSTFNVQTGRWQQTWVDNQGGYLDFVGEFKDGKMILQRHATIEGRDVLQRMVWYNIAQADFDWNWERSDDDGETWRVLWQIHYVRRD